MKTTIRRLVKILSAALTFVMLFSVAIPSGAKYHKDVASTDWALDAISFVSDNGYLTFTDYFSGTTNITRLELAP